ncbi:MAG: papain-like cysteine protease family protein [Candidatus Eremiobacterota bacterium]
MILLLFSCYLYAEGKERNLPAKHLIYGVPYEAQPSGSSYCGEASLYMIIHYWNEKSNVTQEELVQELFSPIFDSTFPSAIEHYLTSKGFTIVTDRSGNMETIKQYICQDIPVLVVNSMTSMNNAGHFRLVIGYDDDQEEITCHDPALGNNYIMTYKEFSGAWDFYHYWMMASYPSDYKEKISSGKKEPYMERTDNMNGKVFMVRGRDYLRSGYYMKSIEELKKSRALATDPTLVFNIDLLESEAFINIKNFDKAENIIYSYGDQVENIPYFCYLLAKINYLKRDYEKGASYASIAIDRDPALASACVILGKCQKEMGQIEFARMSFKKALSIDITSDEAMKETVNSEW